MPNGHDITHAALPGAPEYPSPVTMPGGPPGSGPSPVPIPGAPPEPPPITAPPVRDWDTGSARENVRPVFGGGTKGVVGSIAYLGDAVLRGAMKGRQAAQQQQFAKADRLMKGFQYTYQTASQQYLEGIRAGKDPNSKEMLEIAGAADSAHAAMMQMYGNYLGQGQKKGKKKGGAGGQGAAGAGEENPIMLMQSQDPADKLRAWLMIQQKLGPSYKHQAVVMQAERQQQERDPARQHAQFTAQEQAEFDQAQREGNTKKIQELQARADERRHYEKGAPKPTADKKIAEYVGEDKKKHIIWQRPGDNTTYETSGASDVKPTGTGVGAETVSESSTSTDINTGATHTTRRTHKVLPAANAPSTMGGGSVARADGTGVTATTPSQQPSRKGGVLAERSETGGTEDDAHNPAFEGLNPSTIDLVKKIANYDVDINKVTSLRGAQRQQIMQRVVQYDPTFDGTQYDVRRKTKLDFTPGGQAGRNVRSINTVIAHLDKLEQAAANLDNSSINVWNSIANKFEQATGDPKLDKFNIAANAVESEAAAVFKGMGATDQEIKSWRASIRPNMSPEQFKESFNQLLGLMAGRMGALSNQWQQGMGKPRDFHLLSDTSRQILQRLGGDELLKADIVTEKRASGGGGAKVLTRAQIQRAAKDHNVSYDEAKKQAEGQGYQVRE